MDISEVGLAQIQERIAPSCPTCKRAHSYLHQTYPRNAQACGERTNSQEGVNGGRKGGRESLLLPTPNTHECESLLLGEGESERERRNAALV